MAPKKAFPLGLKMRSRWIAAAAALLLLQGIAEAAEIRLFASGALKEAYLELIPAFEKASGHKVELEWSSTTEIRKRVSAGEIHDLVILGDSGTEALIRDGKLTGTTRVVFAKSGISIAVRAGARRPNVRSADTLQEKRCSRRNPSATRKARAAPIWSACSRSSASTIRSRRRPSSPGPIFRSAQGGERRSRDRFPSIKRAAAGEGIDIIGPLPGDLQS